jgi:hypothetical protein
MHTRRGNPQVQRSGVNRTWRGLRLANMPRIPALLLALLLLGIFLVALLRR